jgi:hypothetical protein
MKVRVNLTIEDNLLTRIKRYAANKKMSVSELVESYFKDLTKPNRKQNILEMVDKLEKPAIGGGKDLKKEFYENQAGKYGF